MSGLVTRFVSSDGSLESLRKILGYLATLSERMSIGQFGNLSLLSDEDLTAYIHSGVIEWSGTTLSMSDWFLPDFDHNKRFAVVNLYVRRVWLYKPSGAFDDLGSEIMNVSDRGWQVDITFDRSGGLPWEPGESSIPIIGLAFALLAHDNDREAWPTTKGNELMLPSVERWCLVVPDTPDMVYGQVQSAPVDDYVPGPVEGASK